MKKKSKLAILTILFKTNNILYTLTDLNGNVIFWTSLGARKYKGIRKLTSTSALSITKRFIAHVYNFNYKHIFIKIKGFNKNKKQILKFLAYSPLNILLISDKTSFPHNGCKNIKNKNF